MVHCRERGDEMIVGDLSHLHIYEQGGSAQVSEQQDLHSVLLLLFLHNLLIQFVVFKWKNSVCVCVFLLTQLAGIHSTTVTTHPDGTFDLEMLESKIRHLYPNPHYPRSRLICVENTHNIQGGRVLPLHFLQEVI